MNDFDVWYLHWQEIATALGGFMFLFVPTNQEDSK